MIVFLWLIWLFWRLFHSRHKAVVHKCSQIITLHFQRVLNAQSPASKFRKSWSGIFRFFLVNLDLVALVFCGLLKTPDPFVWVKNFSCQSYFSRPWPLFRMKFTHLTAFTVFSLLVPSRPLKCAVCLLCVRYCPNSLVLARCGHSAPS